MRETPGPPSRAELLEDLRTFRLAGRPGFRDRQLPALHALRQVQERAGSRAKRAINDALDAVIDEAIENALGEGAEVGAMRLQFGYVDVPDKRAPVKHKDRAEAAAQAADYSLYHYYDAILPGILDKLITYLLEAEDDSELQEEYDAAFAEYVADEIRSRASEPLPLWDFTTPEQYFSQTENIDDVARDLFRKHLWYHHGDISDVIRKVLEMGIFEPEDTRPPRRDRRYIW